MAEPFELSEPSGRLPPLEELLACLRRLAEPCEPPVGVGAFDVLYANAREVVVWYSPARPEHHPGEVVIQTTWLADAWGALVRGEVLDEMALTRLGEGMAGGRWLLALLSQAPGVSVRDDPLALMWTSRSLEPPEHEQATVRSRRGKSRGTAAG